MKGLMAMQFSLLMIHSGGATYTFTENLFTRFRTQDLLTERPHVS